MATGRRYGKLGKIFDQPRRGNQRLKKYFEHSSITWEIEDFFNLAADVPYHVGPPFYYSQCLWEMSLLRKHSFDRHTTFDLHIALLDGNESFVVVNCSTGLLKTNDRMKPLQSTECIFENCKDTYDSIENPLKGLRPSAKIGEIKIREVYEQRYRLAPHDLLRIVLNLKRNTFDMPHMFVVDASAPFVFKDFSTLARDFASLLENQWGSDVTVKVQKKEYKVHRSVLIAQSPVFKAMFAHDMMENQTSIINITDCSSCIFEKFLMYVYSGLVEKDLSPRNALKLFTIAHKYAVPELENFLIHYLIETLHNNNVCNALVVADTYEVRKLYSAILRFFVKNWDKIVITEEWKQLRKLHYPVAKELLDKLSSRGIRI